MGPCERQTSKSYARPIGCAFGDSCYSRHPLPVVDLKTDQFLLRPWCLEDAPSLAKHLDNRNVWINLRERFPKPYTVENAKTWILRREREDARSIQLAIVVEDLAVGGIGIDRDPNPKTRFGELGYWLGEDYWNQGISGQAIAMVSDWAFREQGFQRLQALVRDSNEASSHLLEKAGFSVVSKIRRGGRRPSAHVTELVYQRNQ